MNMIYYFIIYAELRWTLSRYRTWNDYDRWCLIDVLIYKITWWSKFLENNLVEFSIIQACPLQGPTMSCTLIAPRSLDHKTTSLDQLCSIELPMYAHWLVFPLKWPVSHIAFPYRMWSSAANFPFRHSCLTDVYKDGLGLSQALPTTVSPPQLWSYRVV